MPSAFRRIADELDPTFVPEWASHNRRPVPTYAKRLLALFGPWFLPRLGLSLIVIAAAAQIAAGIMFVARGFLPATLAFLAGVLASVVGSSMWSAYRMRHWIPGAAASTAPLAAPIPRRVWVWMSLAVVVILGGLALMVWLIAADGSARAVVTGIAIFMVCASVGASVLMKQSDAVSDETVTIAGLKRPQLGVLFLVGSVILAAMLFAQVPFLPATR